MNGPRILLENKGIETLVLAPGVVNKCWMWKLCKSSLKRKKEEEEKEEKGEEEAEETWKKKKKKRFLYPWSLYKCVSFKPGDLSGLCHYVLTAST